jgi:DNA-binding HxlR family transcriptional regulator
MKPSLRSRRSDCPIACALDLVGDKWTLVVLRDIIMGRRRHFHELLAGNEGIASNILASRVQRLEAEGMITRRRDQAAPKRVIYEPTGKALDLLPVMIELMRWAMKYDPTTAAPAQFLRRLAADRDKFIAEICAAHNPPGRRSGVRSTGSHRVRASASRRKVV